MYVDEEFEAYLKCGRFEYGFLRVRCESCHAEKLVVLIIRLPDLIIGAFISVVVLRGGVQILREAREAIEGEAGA